MESVGTAPAWIGFAVLVLTALALDLGVFNRKAHAPSMREATTWTLVWIALALAFNAVVWRVYGPVKGMEFLTGYVIEKALSVDNLFVFLVLFRTLGVEPRYQHRVLFWGILGALVMRGVFIFAGAALIASVHWIMYVFGGFLVLTGAKLLLQRDVEPHPERNPLVRLFARFVPMTPTHRDGRFVVVENGRRLATPLLLALIAAEATDLVFAVDSIPAVFAITLDPFIVFTSNIFAILGLRTLYFVLAGMMDRFHYLKIGLALVLVFVGAKMTLVDVYHVPINASLLTIVGILGTAVTASLLRPPGPGAAGAGANGGRP